MVTRYIVETMMCHPFPNKEETGTNWPGGQMDEPLTSLTCRGLDLKLRRTGWENVFYSRDAAVSDEVGPAPLEVEHL